MHPIFLFVSTKIHCYYFFHGITLVLCGFLLYIFFEGRGLKTFVDGIIITTQELREEGHLSYLIQIIAWRKKNSDYLVDLRDYRLVPFASRATKLGVLNPL